MNSPTFTFPFPREELRTIFDLIEETSSSVHPIFQTVLELF